MTMINFTRHSFTDNYLVNREDLPSRCTSLSTKFFYEYQLKCLKIYIKMNEVHCGKM